MSLIPLRVLLGTRQSRIISRLINRLPLQCPFHSSPRVLSLIDKDLPTPVQLTPLEKLYENDKDILLEQLQKARTVERILELVSMHLDIMNNKHIVTSFNCINGLIPRTIDGGFRLETELVKDEVFQSLCSQVMSKARHLKPDEVIIIYKSLCKLNIPSNTYIMQSILKMLCHQINELDLNQLTFVNFLLSKHRPNSLADSLKLAIPLVLQVQIDQQLDGENLQETITCLEIACKAKLKASTIEKIVAVLQKKALEFNAEQASSVIFSLFLTNAPIKGYLQLIESSFNVINKNIFMCRPTSLLSLCRLCIKQTYYNSTFYFNLSKRVIAERWPLSDLFEVSSRLYKVGFFSPELADLLCEEICNNANEISENPKYSLLTLSENLSIADYQPTQIRQALDVLSSCHSKLDFLAQNFSFLFIKLISCWAMHGYFPKEEMIQRILDVNYLYSAWSMSKKHGRSVDFELYVSCLSWALEIHNQEFCLPKQFMSEVHRSVQQKQAKTAEFPLSKFLESGLGGEQFFKNGMLTSNGHFIDHIVAMRNGNYPVSLYPMMQAATDNQQCFVEDISVPDDTKIIAVLCVKGDHFCTFPDILKIYMTLKLKSLKKLSLCPIVVNYDTWYEMADKEKIPFLMREIKQVTETGNVQDQSTVLPS